MIHFLTGKPGAGKGLVAMKEIIDELRLSKRPIVTNLAVRLHPWVSGAYVPQQGLLSFLHRTYGTTFNAEKRIRILSDDEMRTFYLFRLGYDLPSTKDSKGRVESFDVASLTDSGVFYVLDEVWKTMGARDWQDTGKGLLFYNAQHRKLGDEVYLCTQSFRQVDTAVRQVAQDYLHVRNHGFERLGVFRQPNVFTVSYYQDPPGTSGSPSLMKKTFRLDREGIASCYDTSAGVGVGGGRAADVGARKSGLAFSWIFVFAVIALVLVAGGVHYGRKTLGFVLTGKWDVGAPAEKITRPAAVGAPAPQIVGNFAHQPDATGHAITHSQNLPAVSPEATAVVRPGPASLTRAGGIPSIPAQTDVFLTGVIAFGQTAAVMLSDGSSYKMTDPAVELVTEKFVVIYGRLYKWPTRPIGSVLADKP